jgi:hypothetical protein
MPLLYYVDIVMVFCQTSGSYPWSLEPSRRPAADPPAKRIWPGINMIRGSVRMPLLDFRADQQTHDVSSNQ